MTPITELQEDVLFDIDQARRELLARAYALILSPAWDTPQDGDAGADALSCDAPADAGLTQPHDG